MPNQPGVRVIQNTDEEAIVTVEAELPTCIVGPLYEVFEKEESSTQFDPLTSGNTTVTWPNKRTGTVVDLAGTRNGYIDSQRRGLADFVPTVYLVDGTVSNTVDDDFLAGLDQTGFDILPGVSTGLERGSFTYYPISLNNAEVLYNPNGGLGDIEVGDRLTVGATDSTVATVTDTKVTVTEDISTDVATASRVDQDESDSMDIDITPSATAGRIVVTMTHASKDFTTEVAGIAAGDVAVTAVPMNGLTSVQGTLTDVDSIQDLLEDSPAGGDSGFGVDITLSEVENYVVKVVNYTTDNTYTTVAQTYFTTLAAIDTTAGTMDVNDTVGAAADYVEVTVMEAQLGYIESINAPTNDEIVVVVPETFSDSLTFVDVYTTSSSSNVFPLYDIEVDYRALRKDLANSLIEIQQESEFLSETDHDAVHYKDELGWAFRVANTAQPNERAITLIPVDVEPTGTTGLQDNVDLASGYTEALEAAEPAEVYSMVLLDRSASIDSTLESHVTSQSTETEGLWRRGFFVEEIPLGSTNSSTGEIAPGRVPGGIADTASDGNTTIKDANVNFSTGASVVAGTTVVVEYPPEFAGEYTADASTTDNDLILTGDVWTLTKEFSVSSVDVNTPSTDTHTIGGAPTDTWVHVQAGDYVEVTVSSTIYRLPVVSVNSAGTEITCSDEVPGTLDFGTGQTANGSNASVIRTWSPSAVPAVEYHIDPLTKAEQVTQLVANQTRSNRRFSVMLDYSPTMQVDTDASGNAVKEVLDPSLSLCAIAAKRSGLRAFDEVTNLVLGGGIEKVQYGYGYFKKSQLKELSDAGYLLLRQKTSSSEPFIHDMITSDTGSIITQEEIVTAGGDWISKTLVNTYVAPPGAQLPILTKRLIGIRTAQIHAILKAWVDEGRILDYTINSVQRNSTNKRQLDISLTLVMPLAEKEIEFTLNLTV